MSFRIDSVMFYDASGGDDAEDVVVAVIRSDGTVETTKRV